MDVLTILRINIYPDSKEEILTITSPSPDECTDSGIENNRYTSTPHSPSTSTDFSPRSDKNIFSSSGVDRRIISPTNRFIRPASPSIEDVPPPLPMNPPPPLPLEHEEEFIKDLELDIDKRDIDQNTSYKTQNRTSSEESLKLDQVVVGLTLKKDQTSESDVYKSIFDDRETIVKTTSTTYPSHFGSLTRPTITEQIEKPSHFIKETTANFNCQKTYEENARVDAVVAQQAHDSTSKHVIKEAKLWKQNLMKEIPLEISPLATMETTKKADSSRDKSTRTVSVGVEVCREQNAKVSAFKFPHKLSRESVVFTVKPASKMTPTVSHFRAVDIPFDDTPTMVETHTANGLEGGNLPDSNGLMVVKMQLSAAEFQGFDNHGFGFSIKGGKEQNAPLTVDTVVVNTAADRCGLQVGDIVLSINGESTVDRYYQTARRMLNEAIRLGEVEVQIQRSPVPLTTFHKDTNKEPESQLTKSPSFDDKRIVFERKPSESNSYYEFKQKKRFEGSPDSVAKASGSISSISPQSSKSSDYGHDDTASDHLTDSKESDSLQRLHRRTPKKMSRSGSPDYRVVSLDEKRDPGKLDDFVPEVEREGRKVSKDNEDDENTLPRMPSRKTDRNEEPKLIRNYDLNLVKSSNESLHSIKSRNSFQKESVSTTDGNKENDTSLERPVVDTREWRQFIREQRLPNPGHTASLNRIDADSKFQIIHKPNSGVANISPTSRPIITTVHRNPSGNKHEVREIPVKLQTASYASPQKPSRRNDSTATQQSRDEPIMSVSGKHRCAHCDQELGRGAAMIIESLNLFYHLSCFRCYVCNIALGNGTKGADVRVRDAKLHCQKCYSNDEVGMKFSQI